MSQSGSANVGTNGVSVRQTVGSSCGSSRKGLGSVISTKSSVTLRKEAEAARLKQLHQIDKLISQKKMEFSVMEGKIRTTQRKLQLLQGRKKTDAWNEDCQRELNNYEDRLIEYEEKRDVLKAEVVFLEETAPAEKSVINKEHDAVVEDLLENDDGKHLSDAEEIDVGLTYDRVQSYVENLPQLPNTSQHGLTSDTNRQQINTQKVIGASPSENNGVLGAVSPDKDMLMIHLMQTQLNMMQTGNNCSHSHFIGEKELPRFSGRPEEWLSFESHYNRIKSKYDEDNLDKLSKALRGPAREAVKFLFNCPSNVKAIMETLKLEFGRPELVIDSLIRNVEQVKNPDVSKPELIVEFARAVQTLVASIRGHNKQDYLNNVYLLNKFVDKLPQQMKRNWFQWYSSKPSAVKNLELFESFIVMEKQMACEFLKPARPIDDDERKERRRRLGSGIIQATVGKSTAEVKSNLDCPCCGKNGHYLDKCWSFSKKNCEERWKIVTSTKVCFSCLRSGHWLKSCFKKEICGLDGCVEFHHRSLHGGESKKGLKKSSINCRVIKNQPTTQDNSRSAVVDDEVQPLPGAINLSLISGCDGPQPIIPVRIRGPLGERKAFALLDGGATRSMIRKDIADELGLTGRKAAYTYYGISGIKITEMNSVKCDLEIKGIYRGATFSTMYAAQTVTALPLPAYSIDMDEVKKKYPHLQKVRAGNLTNAVPDLIVGNNNPLLILSRQIVTGKPGEPVGWRTKLGWTISGNFDNEGTGSFNLCCHETDNYLHDLIKESFTTDNFGVKVSSNKGITFAERRAYAILEKTTKKVGERWETGLLWREDNPKLPESEAMAYKRLLCTERKMQNLEFCRKYNEKIEEYRKKGYIRKLTQDEVKKKHDNTFYIPHFGVYNPNKPGKFRLVFDAAAKTHGKSLNDFLLTGPDLIRPLTSVLLNFRIHKIALTGDITDMFHRVFIREQDQPSQRFLWRDGDTSKVPDHYQMEVMIFGATCSPSSAIFVKNRNADEYKEQFPHEVEVIQQEFYVDDVCTGGDNTEEVIQLRRRLSDINGAGGFVLCKWTSSSDAVMSSIPLELQAEGMKSFTLKEDAAGERVLGLWWDPKKDCFSFKVVMHKVKPEVLAGRTPTKRELCSVVMSLYDPLGFINHFKIKGIMMLQQTWVAGIGWDDELPFAIVEKWKGWLKMIEGITKVKVSRCYSQSLRQSRSIQLHIFMDASEEAFAAVAYLRVESEIGVDVVFVCSKAKVAPIKKLTIPKLELQAAVLSSRIAVMLKEELKIKINSRVFWTDSRTVLSWVRSLDRKYKEFMANRIGEIQEETSPSEWRWVPTKQNVADVATRFSSEISFENDSIWYAGPAFLKEGYNKWPEEIRSEMGPVNENEASGFLLTLGGESQIIRSIPEGCGHSLMERVGVIVPDPYRFSSYTRLLRATAAVQVGAKIWMKKALHLGVVEVVWKGVSVKKKGKDIIKIIGSALTASDLLPAEKSLIKAAQEEAFAMEIAIIDSKSNQKQKRAILKKGRIWKLCPILVDGILRMDGRIKTAQVGTEVKFPAILPSKHRITDLIIDQEHVRACHQGIGTVMVALQQKFIVVAMREAVKRGWRRCQFCKIRNCQPIQPMLGDLPYFRLASKQPPFYFTGLDYFGPMEVTVGRRHEKRWGVIFCCMTTRAIHLEIAHSLSTDEAMMAISRFIDSRGRPHTIFSDNGGNFIGAARELKENFQTINFDLIKEHEKFQEIHWKFQAARSPHMSGVWERMVGSVKRCLGALLKEKYPKDTTLLTFIKAVENIVNSRPLTTVSTDPLDSVPITPNDILRGGCDVGPSIPVELDASDEFLRVQWRRAQLMADTFWIRWTREFLPQLIRREKWLERAEPLQVGDLVFLVDEQLPRNQWLRGVISMVKPGNDGQVRYVEINVRDSTTKRVSTLKRAANRVCPLGLRMKIQSVGDSLDLGPDCRKESLCPAKTTISAAPVK